MLFKDNDHFQFFALKTEGNKDVYYQTLVYTLGICNDTRKRFDELYDEKERGIISGAINAAWQTGSSRKVTRLAFNLFTDRTPTSLTYDESNNTVEEDFNECRKYSVSDIFCCEFAPYFVEAIRIRYPEYMRKRGIERRE